MWVPIIDSMTDVLKVPGGMVIRTIDEQQRESIVFVPCTREEIMIFLHDHMDEEDH